MDSATLLVIIAVTAFSALSYTALLVVGLRRRNVGLWWRDYLRHLRERPGAVAAGTPTHVMFCFVDHFEPRWGKADFTREQGRVARWVEGYPKACEGHRDADGFAPRHTFFFPSEEYHPDHLDRLTALCAAGFGEIEVHLHHDDDTEAGLRANLREFLDRLVERHDALPLGPGGTPQWAFIHGNWALDNSRADGRWCGVNNEIAVLADMGCYGDFTLPSAPSDTQTATVNSLYYATDDPARPRSHDTGVRVRAGGRPSGDLMILQGPLCLRWKLRGWLPVPAIENGDIRAENMPTPRRVDAWVRTGIHVEGRPDWVFVKIHTHGTQDRDMEALLDNAMPALFTDLEQRYNDGVRHVLHYVTAREMYNIARAAEAGHAGNPGAHRDFAIPRPRYRPPGMQST